MIIHKSVIQGSEEWLALRKGKVTASRMSDILTPHGLVSKSADKYIFELIGECFVPDFIYWSGNAATDRGSELEPEARKAFIERTGLPVEEVGFITMDNRVVGCSPDGVVFDAAGNVISGLEIKCPSPKTHIEYVADGALPPAYKLQVHGAMAVTGASSWHFFSYFPGLEPFHIIVTRDDFTEKLVVSLEDFVIKYSEEWKRLIPLLHRIVKSTATE